MDLDDSFTEQLLSRRKATKAVLNTKKADSPNTVGKKRAALVDEHQLSDQGVSNAPPEESPKRQCIEHLPKKHEHEDEVEKENVAMEEDDVDDPYVPFKASSNRGLAALRRKTPIDMEQEEETSNQVTLEAEVNKTKTYIFSTNSSDLCTARKTRLNNLAANINQWEDDLHRPTLSTNNVTSLASKRPLSNLTSSSSDSNSFSVKLHYTDKAVNSIPPSSKESGDQFARSLGSNFEKTSSMPPPVKKGNIEGSSGSGKLGGRLDAWNQAIKATMETDELIRSPVKKASKFNEKDSVKDVKVPFQREVSNTDMRSIQPTAVKEKNVTNTKGCMDRKPNDTLNKSMDPAELPLSARKALFENSAFGGNAKPSEQTIEPKLSIAQRAALFEKAANTSSKPKTQVNFGIPKRVVSQSSLSPAKPAALQAVQPATLQTVQPAAFQTGPASVQNIPLPPPPPPPMQQSPIKKTVSVQKDEKSAKEVFQNSPVKTMSPGLIFSPQSPSKDASNHIRLVQQQLVERAANNWQEKDIVAKAVDERKKEIFDLMNRHVKSSSSSVGSNTSEEEKPMHDETEDYPESEEEYASEYTESEYTERESEFEFDERVQQNQYHGNEYEMESNISDQDDQYEDEDPDVFNHEDEELSDVVEPTVSNNEIRNDAGHFRKPENIRKAGSSDTAASSLSSVGSSCVSNILSCGSGSSAGSISSSKESPVPFASNGEKPPLQYTVSFYRKQKQATRTPPLKTIVRREQVDISPPEDNIAQVIQERIQGLQEEIHRQQTIIGQTSQALNLCHATAEFSGSSEQVEGERLLLIATQKRQACLNEIQRLKSHGAQKENISEGAGTLTITDIQLPLKKEFISAQLEGKLNDAVHCFLCLIRHGAQVIVTQMMSTSDKISDGCLSFTNHIKLQNLPADVSVVFEIYALQTRKEQLPHDKKYHIKREQSKIRLTPKGKKAEGKLILPAISSPGGPNAVRSSSFGVVGFTRFTLQNCHKKCFTLDKVPFSSPLEGILRVRLQLHAEHKVTEKGFLTMFEVVTGFGAWHRRWCYLNTQYLLYWKFPGDEHKKEPIGMIDLRKCVTGEVKLIARDICARPHTFELVTLRPREKGDKDLPKEQGNPLTTTKHLLSADTKEERILWCNKLNEALTNVRKWDSQALRPIETEQSTSTFPSSK